MAQIKIEWPAPPADGVEVKFKAPCDCTAVTGILLSFSGLDGSEGTQAFTFRDSHGADLTGLGNLFSAGAYVVAVLDTVNGYAYLQNAATNAYLEGKIRAVSVVLPADGWVDSQQTVEVPGVTEEANLIVTPAPESYLLWGENQLRAVTQSAGAITFRCEDVPSEAVTANILIVG